MEKLPGNTLRVTNEKREKKIKLKFFDSDFSSHLYLQNLGTHPDRPADQEGRVVALDEVLHVELGQRRPVGGEAALEVLVATRQP